MRTMHFFTILLLCIGIGLAAAIPAGAQDFSPRIALNPAEEYALARYCASRTAGEPFVCRLSVAAAMLNRLDDPRFPDTVSGVLQDAGYRSPPVRDEDLASARWAVRVAAMGVDPTAGSLYWAWAGTADAAALTPRLTVGKRVFGVKG